ncbi:c-type cytochrome [Microbulbifer pacificus]|uniref:C-type cytochrome n=1 Tax=Microbulbifer pacificus TaxID=407164 RepID=A0AAU0N4Q6_9GAMM|nr:c-type cytochrome [Microbulbifer pacificus]WOX06576.1 c-type cytochrome [Microbulbifer pacificus]
MKASMLSTVCFLVGGMAMSGLVVADAVEDKYKSSCYICHDTGVANAPKLHDVEAWKPRLDKGTDALLNSIKNGLNAMPAGGMCSDCSEDDYKALIQFMSSPKS